jgi:hypothetical protein
MDAPDNDYYDHDDDDGEDAEDGGGDNHDINSSNNYDTVSRSSGTSLIDGGEKFKLVSISYLTTKK